MAHGKRCTRLLSGTGLAVAAALAVQGCTSAPASTATRASTATASAPAVTAAEASRAFAHYLASATTVLSTAGETSALANTTDVARIVLSATFRSLNNLRAPALPGSPRYGKPVFYLPEPAGYPQWFVAVASRTYAGPPPAAGGTVMGMPAGIPGTAGSRVLMVFQKAGADAGWKVASISQLAPGASLPALATDRSGHVPTVPLSDTALLARPDVAGALQAAVVDDGPASPAARVVASGPLTTGIYDAERASLLGLKAPPGDVYQWELEGSNYSRFALRTADGGALVFYSMYLNTTVAVPAALDNSYPVKPGPAIPVPGFVASLLPAGKTAPRVMLESQELLSFGAVDPPAGKAKKAQIAVIAIGGGLSYADAS